MQAYQIGADEAQQRLDKYLKKLLKNAPDSFIYKMLRKKNIVLNGRKCDGKEKLSAGDEVKLFLSDDTIEKFVGKEDSSQLQEYNHAFETLRNISILYEDENILVVNKPAGILSQRATASDDSVNEWLIGYLLHHQKVTQQSLTTFKPSICNRLDRNTSGMVVCGKTLAGSQYMSSIIKDKSLAKYYTCIVNGQVNDSFRIKGYLYKDTGSNKVTVYSSEQEIPLSQRNDALFIDTEVRPLITTQHVSKLEIRLYTGRTHQIRAHMASVGHPLIGDPKYGSSAVNRKYHSLGVKGQLLHACRLEFPTVSDERFQALSGLVLTCKEPAVFDKILSE